MNIIVQPNAKKSLKKLPSCDVSLILKKLYSIREDPLRYIQRLQGSKLWKLRIGDYRAVLFVDTKVQEIHVVMIGHRKEIYKKL